MMMVLWWTLALWAQRIELRPRAGAFLSPTVDPTPVRRRATGMDPCAGHHHLHITLTRYMMGKGLGLEGDIRPAPRETIKSHNLWAGMPGGLEAAGACA